MARAPDAQTRADVVARYGHRIRVRAGAILFDDPGQPAAVLLVEHAGMHDGEPFWTPPGGEVEFGEALSEALRREAREETGLDISVGPLRFVSDFVRPPLHTVSFFFEAGRVGGDLRAGKDPELGGSQLIRSVRMVPFSELNGLRVYPEGLSERIVRLPQGGPHHGAEYLGTLR